MKKTIVKILYRHFHDILIATFRDELLKDFRLTVETNHGVIIDAGLDTLHRGMLFSGNTGPMYDSSIHSFETVKIYFEERKV